LSATLVRQSVEEDAARQLILEAIRCLQSDNFESYFDLFSEDAVWMMPSKFGDVGIAEARKFYNFTAKFRFEQESTIDELRVFEDWGFARLSFDGYLVAKQDSTAAPIRSVSRHIWMIARQPSGRWKITRDMWNNPRDTQNH
jgi:ketosteroid isomerase-like protein